MENKNVQCDRGLKKFVPKQMPFSKSTTINQTNCLLKVTNRFKHRANVITNLISICYSPLQEILPSWMKPPNSIWKWSLRVRN